jgi:hypothetical protein
MPRTEAFILREHKAQAKDTGKFIEKQLPRQMIGVKTSVMAQAVLPLHNYSDTTGRVVSLEPNHWRIDSVSHLHAADILTFGGSMLFPLDEGTKTKKVAERGKNQSTTNQQNGFAATHEAQGVSCRPGSGSAGPRAGRAMLIIILGMQFWFSPSSSSGLVCSA